MVSVGGVGPTRSFLQPKELRKLVAWLGPHEEPQVVMESTGRYERGLQKGLLWEGIPCSVVNPAKLLATQAVIPAKLVFAGMTVNGALRRADAATAHHDAFGRI